MLTVSCVGENFGTVVHISLLGVECYWLFYICLSFVVSTTRNFCCNFFITYLYHGTPSPSLHPLAGQGDIFELHGIMGEIGQMVIEQGEAVSKSIKFSIAQQFILHYMYM